MLYFVHEIGPFHGQMSPEVLLVHGIGSFHGQVPSELIFVHEAGSFMDEPSGVSSGIPSVADPKMADLEENSENSGLVLCGFFSFL